MNESICIQYPGDINSMELLNSTIRRRIGDMCFVSDVSSETDAVKIGIYADEIVTDSVSDEVRVKFIRRENVFQGYFEDGDFGKVLILPSRDEMKESIKKQKLRSIERSEGAVLESAGSRILKIPQVKNQMNPIYEIITNLLYSESVKRSHFNWTREKMDRYLDFLSDLGIVRASQDSIVPGPAMERNMDTDMDYDDLYEEMIGEVVEKNMIQVMYGLNMTHIQPFIRMGNANCMMSLFENSALRWDSDLYRFYMGRIYPGKKDSKSKIISNASTLSQVGIFDKEIIAGRDAIFYCKDEIFNEYSNSARAASLY